MIQLAKSDTGAAQSEIISLQLIQLAESDIGAAQSEIVSYNNNSSTSNKIRLRIEPHQYRFLFSASSPQTSFIQFKIIIMFKHSVIMSPNYKLTKKVGTQRKKKFKLGPFEKEIN